jgi:hypothetical protein
METNMSAPGWSAEGGDSKPQSQMTIPHDGITNHLPHQTLGTQQSIPEDPEEYKAIFNNKGKKEG